MLARLLLLAAFACAHAAAIYEFPGLIRRIPERTVTPGCAYKGERYAPGQQVETTEPCLNCTCIRAVVVCYLRVCPAPASPPPRCFMAREVGQCCPTLVCGGDDNATSSVPQLRPTFAPSTTPVIETTESDSLLLVSSAPPEDLHINDIATNKGCLVNGTLYGDGSAMLSSTFCEYCFCIRGKTNCVKPKCDLVIEGCTPHYDSSFSCCPSRYDCFSKSEFNQVVKASKTTTTSPAPTSTSPEGCEYQDQIYQHGEVLPDYKACHSCICSNQTVICDQMKCSPPLEGCQPIIPEGHCCPVSYKCNYNDDANKYNVKGANSDDLDSISIKTETKTVKQSDLFKTANEEEKAQPEKINFFHNFVPIHRRLDEEIYHRFNPQDNANKNSHTVGAQISETTTDELLTTNEVLINSETETIPTYSITKDDTQINSEKPIDLTTTNTPLISVGLPEHQTISMDSLINDFFVNNHQTDTESVTEQTQNLQRNNSKLPSSIVELFNSETTLDPFYNEEGDGTNSTKQELSTHPPTTTTESTSTIIQKQSFTESSMQSESRTTKNVDSTMIHTTLFFTKDGIITDDTTPYLVTNKDGRRTFLPLTTNSRSVTQTTPTTFTTEKDPTEDMTTVTVDYSTRSIPKESPITTVADITDETTEDLNETSSSINDEKVATTAESLANSSLKDPTTTEPSKSHVRINSKQPINTYAGNDEKDIEARHPILEDSLVNLYLPAMGREESDDFTNVGSIHLGAPLSVGDEVRKDPSNFRNKITESGGVIFMDPKYTDINPSLPTTEYRPSEMNPVDLTYPTPIDRADTEPVKYDRKKGPRIQDGYNQTDPGQSFKIIPFIAEDAIRGKFGKLNHTFTGNRDTTQGVPDMVSDFCFIKGRIYMNGEMIVKQDPCELCRCFYGQELCQLQRCPTPPPDCIPEKLPNFCCPRYTCVDQSGSRGPQEENLMGNFQPKIPDTTTKQDIPNNPTQTSSSETDHSQFGVRFHQKPPITRPRDMVPKTTQIVPQVTTSTRPILSTLLTTQLPETRRPSSSKAPDHRPSSTTELPKSPFSDPWGLLRVSGCNIYGKFFNINDQVEILSGPCSHCICTASGVECNDIC